jgi:hypothetical protein
MRHWIGSSKGVSEEGAYVCLFCPVYFARIRPASPTSDARGATERCVCVCVCVAPTNQGPKALGVQVGAFRRLKMPIRNVPFSKIRGILELNQTKSADGRTDRQANKALSIHKVLIKDQGGWVRVHRKKRTTRAMT